MKAKMCASSLSYSQNENTQSESFERIKTVEKILDKQIVDKEVIYLIQWVGLPSEMNSWESASNLVSVQLMIQEFENKLFYQSKNQEINAINNNNIIQDNNNKEIEEDYQIKEILSVKTEEDQLLFEVYWKKRNQHRPQNSWISQQELQQHNPEMLINFLFRKLKQLTHN